MNEGNFKKVDELAKTKTHQQKKTATQTSADVGAEVLNKDKK